jgi:outer membrane protein OmpA-like peptidoglycan-associated protein
MHSNISITDGTYGMLSNADKKKLLSNFNPDKPDLQSGLNKKLDEILALLKQNTPTNSE